ncbi:hypothetical protein [Acetobacter sp.]|uniref:hypothetical protein n=1 Tax=Acetobacter sp. TaxID=440 RepID=UPI0039EAD073
MSLDTKGPFRKPTQQFIDAIRKSLPGQFVGVQSSRADAQDDDDEFESEEAADWIHLKNGMAVKIGYISEDDDRVFDIISGEPGDDETLDEEFGEGDDAPLELEQATLDEHIDFLRGEDVSG